MAPRSSIGGPPLTIIRAAVALIVLAGVAGFGPAPQLAKAAALAPAFPRIAVWWPDCDRQPISDLARADWIALQSQDADRIAALHAENPDLVVLGSTSARELNYVLGDYDNPHNVELRSASTDWMLTQVGSTLTADISASATSIPVADVTKFAAGEMVLVDHELVHVVALGASSLRVSARGLVNAPSAHDAGARIAAVVSHWPNSITFDMTANCPRVQVDERYGPETWNEWNVRRGRAALQSAPWDGLLIDTLESDVSWMVKNGDVRSIDPLRTNQPVADGYKSFNDAWASGATAYGVALRAAAGSSILLGNGNLRNFALNGAIFEQFPDTDFAATRWAYVFIGPYPTDCPNNASYPEWCAGTPAPNMTTIQTYGAVGNYKLMRYGLCSALLADGYFSYARSSSGHAVNGIWNYDEYDNAGTGRGYLGQPLAAAVKAGGAWRRDFSGGVALVNPTASAVTVNLGGTFRKIQGRQDPAVNDGTIATSVTIPGRDGIVVLRVPVLDAAAETLRDGEDTTIRVSGAPAGTEHVRFLRRATGTTAWTQVATLTLGASGDALATIAPRVTTEYRAVSPATGAVSNTVKVGVRPTSTIRASRTALRRGDHVTFTGSISYPGRVWVSLQRLSHGRWKTVARTRTSATCGYRVTIGPTVRGSLRYRVSVAASTHHLASSSPVVRLTVR